MAALKLAIEKLDDVDEGLRPLYAEKDGKFHLQVDGLEDTTGLRSALGKERHARAELEKKVKRWEALGKTDEEITDLIAKHDEFVLKETERSGDFEKAKASIVERHELEKRKLEKLIADNEAKATAAVRAQDDLLVNFTVASAIAAAKGDPELLQPHVVKLIKVDRDTGTAKLTVLDGKGEPRFNGKGEPLSVAEMVMEMRAHEKYGRLFDGTGHSGGGTPPANGGGGSPQTKRRSDLKTRDERVAFVEKYGNDAYLKLPV